jgi:hypothetical protein
MNRIILLRADAPIDGVPGILPIAVPLEEGLAPVKMFTKK